MIGKIAIAMAGHDKGHAYIIIKEEDGFVYLVDGENRKLDNPKRKSIRHVQINQRYDAGEPGRYDHEIKRTLKLFWQHMNNAEV
ncbi:MAG: KOW domain-containing RNA-binding protein [Lachnospiraceae bacterium]|nr:KOW domain-containing RNA-binding protein [Lachnospiraceae bacterium]MDD5854329.1 KOW domain-containing RNA-binding protein [Lachnospiraceae bacterium]